MTTKPASAEAGAYDPTVVVVDGDPSETLRIAHGAVAGFTVQIDEAHASVAGAEAKIVKAQAALDAAIASRDAHAADIPGLEASRDVAQAFLDELTEGA